jgi:hypothetical protein
MQFVETGLAGTGAVGTEALEMELGGRVAGTGAMDEPLKHQFLQRASWYGRDRY